MREKENIDKKCNFTRNVNEPIEPNAKEFLPVLQEPQAICFIIAL